MIISASSADTLLFVIGMNRKEYKNSHQIVSIVSCATSCVSPTAGNFITLCEDVSLFYLLRHLISLIKS